MSNNNSKQTLVESGHNSDGHYAVYDEYSKNLRVWLVGFGVGGPVLFLTQKEVNVAIKASGDSKLIIILFLIGVAAQILLALINKWNNWVLYAKFDQSKSKKNQSRIIKFSSWLSERWLIDVFFDLTSIVLFAWATLRVLFIYV